MLSIFLSRLIILGAGTLYPAYRSYKAVRTKDVKEYVKWMMYWIVYAIFILGETVADTLVSFWFPFYYELKVIFVFWLLSPWTKGASILYRKWVHPLFMKHENEIDAFLEQAKSESYRTVLTLGSRGLMCAREIVATAALRGQAHIAQQVNRSLSMNDVSRVIESQQKKVAHSKTTHYEEQEEEEGEELKVRTWTGYYDENDHVVEQEVHQTMTTIDNEEIVLVEDPHESRPQRNTRKSSRSRSRTIGIDDSSEGYSTLPRRSKRNVAGQAS